MTLRLSNSKNVYFEISPLFLKLEEEVYDGLIGLNNIMYNTHVSERTNCLVVNSPLLGCQGPVLFSRSFSGGLSFRSPFRTLPIETLQIVHLWVCHPSARSGKSRLWKHPNAVLNTFFFISSLYFCYFVLISDYLWNELGPSFENEIYFTQECFVLSLVEIGPVFNLEKMKMWKVYRQTHGRRTTGDKKLTWAHSFNMQNHSDRKC